MSWEDEQSELIEEARLLLSSPDIVFEKLKALSIRIRERGLFWSSRSEAFEPILVERDAPLINLGLACYGTNEDVFKALYKSGIEPHRDATDEAYRRGLRIGCLSNTTIQKLWLSDFPRDLLGEAETERIFAEAEFAEAETLICNPNLSHKVLEQLYRREGPFAKVADQRLAHLVSSSGKNERLNINRDSDHEPDLDHYNIHNAILQLVETAPVNERWMWGVYHLLDKLDPSHVARTDHLEAIIDRWNSLSAIEAVSGKEGLFARNISLADEFRCLIAALYGAGLKKPELEAASKSKDVALRAAYYAHGNLTVSDMKAGLERDEGVFIFAGMYNANMIFHGEKRGFFENSLSEEWNARFQRHVEFVRKRYRRIEPYIPEPDQYIRQDDPDSLRFAQIESAIRSQREMIAGVNTRVRRLLNYIIFFSIFVGTALCLRNYFA
jgi:hypothetical protein